MTGESASILDAIRALPRADRLRLVERVLHELAEDESARPGDPHAIIGMMADEPEVMDRACELAMRNRNESRMRAIDG
ncbi:MAG: hypothetical protein ACOCUS_04040 [Polyangiales bacterium]